MGDGSKKASPSPLSSLMAYRLTVGFLCVSGGCIWFGLVPVIYIGQPENSGPEVTFVGRSRSAGQEPSLQAGPAPAVTPSDSDIAERIARAAAQQISVAAAAAEQTGRRNRYRVEYFPAKRPETIDRTWFMDFRPNVQVFAAGDGAVCWRIPAIVLTAKGTLLAFAEARNGAPGRQCTDAEAHDIGMKRSTTAGMTWEPVKSIVGGRSNPVGNPMAIALRSGRVVLIFHYHPQYGTCIRDDCGGEGRGNGVVISDDDGVTWSPERNVTSDFGERAANGMPGPGAGIQLPSGRLLAVSHMGPYVRDEITYSEDEGRSWRVISQSFPHMDEATLADLGNDQVLLMMRHTDEAWAGKAYARSWDGGMTWEGIDYNQHLIGPVCQASLSAVGDGILLFANPSSSNGRHHITVQASIDWGRTWKKHLLVERNVTRGYSSLVNGHIVKERMLTGILFEATESGHIDFRLFRYNTTRALQAGRPPRPAQRRQAPEGFIRDELHDFNFGFGRW